MKTIEMPKMGDTMEEGRILRWLKKEGDAVKKGEFVAEVETEKVNIEIEAFTSGILRKILVPEGKSAPVGAGIALVGSADEALPSGGSDSAVRAPKQSIAFTQASMTTSTNGTSSTLANSLLCASRSTSTLRRTLHR